MSYQSITILGNLTKDAEVRQVGQSQVASTGIAVSEKFRRADGTIGENTEFFDIEIWDKQSVFPYLKKGTQVLIIGQIRTDKWQDQSGQTRERKKVRVQTIQLCGSKPQVQASAPQQPQYSAPVPPRPSAPIPPIPQYQQSVQPPMPPAPKADDFYGTPDSDLPF